MNELKNPIIISHISSYLCSFFAKAFPFLIQSIFSEKTIVLGSYDGGDAIWRFCLRLDENWKNLTENMM